MNHQNKKIKVAILGTRGYPVVYSGFETWVKEMCRHLGKEYELHIYTHSNLVKEKPKQIDGVFIHYFKTIESKSLSQIIFTFFCTIHALYCNYDIHLYVSTANGPFGWIMKLFGKRTAINTDGLDWLRPKWKGMGGKYFKWGAKQSTRAFDVLISDAEGIADYYHSEFKADSVVITYGAYLQESTNTIAIEKLGLKKDDYYLIVGRLIPDNHVEEIVKGFNNSTTSKKLVVVGDVPYQDDFAMRVKKYESDRIMFTGFVTDQELLKELFANCYCYFHGHAFGGTNPSMLKALAYGCCVLAHDNVFTREMLANDKYGFYFNSDPASVTDTINQLDHQTEMVLYKKSISRNRIAECYTWDGIAKQYSNLFQKMMTEPKWKCNATTYKPGNKSVHM